MFIPREDTNHHVHHLWCANPSPTPYFDHTCYLHPTHWSAYSYRVATPYVLTTAFSSTTDLLHYYCLGTATVLSGFLENKSDMTLTAYFMPR